MRSPPRCCPRPSPSSRTCSSGSPRRTCSVTQWCAVISNTSPHRLVWKQRTSLSRLGKSGRMAEKSRWLAGVTMSISSGCRGPDSGHGHLQHGGEREEEEEEGDRTWGADPRDAGCRGGAARGGGAGLLHLHPGALDQSEVGTGVT